MSERQRVRLPLSGSNVEVDVRWLRSVCSCNVCGDSAAGLRWLSFTDVGQPAIDRISRTGDGFTVRWADGHHSTYPSSVIVRPRVPSTLPDMPGAPRRFDHAAVLADDRTLLDAVGVLCGEGVVLLDRGPVDDAAIIAAAERFGPIRVTSYGQVQVFRTEANPKTAAHTGRAQHPHTDEPFRHSPPGFLFFHSVQAGAPGEGTSVLVDGVAVAESLRSDDPVAFDTLTAVPVLQHRIHDGEVHFEARAPVISLGSSGQIEGIRLNQRCLAPLDPLDVRTPSIISALTAFADRTEDPAHQIRVHLEPGQILAFDNHRVMHGRTAFGDTAPRHLRSCNVDRDAVHSTLRLLAHRFDQPVDFRLLAGASP